MVVFIAAWWFYRRMAVLSPNGGFIAKIRPLIQINHDTMHAPISVITFHEPPQGMCLHVSPQNQEFLTENPDDDTDAGMFTQCPGSGGDKPFPFAPMPTEQPLPSITEEGEIPQPMHTEQSLPSGSCRKTAREEPTSQDDDDHHHVHKKKTWNSCYSVRTSAKCATFWHAWRLVWTHWTRLFTRL